MDYKDPDSTEEENFWLSAHTYMQTEKNFKKLKKCINTDSLTGWKVGSFNTKKKKKTKVWIDQLKPELKRERRTEFQVKTFKSIILTVWTRFLNKNLVSKYDMFWPHKA